MGRKNRYPLGQKSLVVKGSMIRATLQTCIPNRFLQSKNQQNRTTHIVCEARGRAEDHALELQFLRVCSGHNSLRHSLPFKLIVVNKFCTGLQNQILFLSKK